MIIGTVSFSCVTPGSKDGSRPAAEGSTAPVTDVPADDGVASETIREDPTGSNGDPGSTPRETVPEGAGPEMLMRDLTPINGNALFLGVAMRLRNRDEERDAAILHLAEQASRYVRLQAAYRFVSESNTGGIGYLDDVDAVWDAAYADSLVDSVEVLREVSDTVGTYVLGYVPGLPAPPRVPSFGYAENGEPRWITKPPVVPGFLTTVGITTPSRRLRDSLDRADQEALIGLLQQTGTTVRMIEDRRERERTGTEVTVTTAQEADATLRGFYVLARYASRDGRYYYSLAIAREE
jgi:hypothetical protein